MEICKNCIHNKVCVIKAFPDLFENTLWKEGYCVYFQYAESLSDSLKRSFGEYHATRSDANGSNLTKLMNGGECNER